MAGSPPQISALVAARIVDPVDLEVSLVRVDGVADRPHVVNEGERVMELVGELDATGSVEPVFVVERVFTSPANPEPLAT